MLKNEKIYFSYFKANLRELSCSLIIQKVSDVKLFLSLGIFVLDYSAFITKAL